MNNRTHFAFYQLKVQFSLLAVERVGQLLHLGGPSVAGSIENRYWVFAREFRVECIGEVSNVGLLALYQAEPQYRLAADYLSKILALVKVLLYNEFYSLEIVIFEGRFRVAIEFYRSALDQDRMDKTTQGVCGFAWSGTVEFRSFGCFDGVFAGRGGIWHYCLNYFWRFSGIMLCFCALRVH